MEKQTVYLWGFRDEDVQQWPEAFTSDVELVFTTDVPLGAPVVVHGAAAERFQTVAMPQASPDGRLPDAILYLPHGMEAPSGAWTYFDATVHEGDWDTLRALLACPQQFQMAEMADELPVAFLKQLTQPVEALAPADLPLPEEVQHHLRACRTCWGALSTSLAARLRLRHQLLCPSVERLAAYIRGTADVQVERHLAEDCRICRAQAAVLRKELAPRWQTVPLLPAATEILAGVAHDLQQLLRPLVVLINGCFAQQMHPAGAWTRARGASGVLEAVELPSLLQSVQQGKSIMLLRPHRDLTIGWDQQRQALWLDRLHGAGRRRVDQFRVEMCRGEEVLWEADSHQGRVWMPLPELEQALQSGADQMVIRAWEERRRPE